MKIKKLLKYLFIPGLILISAGVTVGLTVKTLLPLSTGLLIGGGIILLIWLVFSLVSGQGFWGKRSTIGGTNAIISTLSFLAILGVINFLAARYSTKIDLTENQIFTLSPQSQEITKNLKDPIKVWLFDNDPSSIDKELLENYRRYNTNFQYEYVNPDEKPGLVKQVGAKSLGDVYLQYGDKKQQIQTLISFGAKEPLSEIKLTNGIEKILRDRTRTVYFLQGHGEHSLDSAEGGLSQAISNLREKGYKVEPLNLAQSSGIPKDADVIVIAGPKQQLFKQEVEALQNYSEQGGNLLILIDPTVDAGLTPLFKQWGVQVDDRIVIDGSGSGELVGLGPATPLITTYGNHPITKDFNNEMSFFPLARAIDTIQAKGVKSVALLITNDKMWAESDLTSEQITFDKTQDIPGPFDLGVALTRIAPATTSTKTEKTNTSQPSPSPTLTPSENKQQPQATPSPSSTPQNEEKPTTKEVPSPSATSTQKQQAPTPATPSPSPTSVEKEKRSQLTPSKSPTQTALLFVSSTSDTKQQTKQNQKETKETPSPDLQIPQTPSPTSSAPSNFIAPDQEFKLDPTSANSPTPSPSVTPQEKKQEQKPTEAKPSPSPVVSPSFTPVVSPSPTSVVSPSPTSVVSPSPTPSPTNTTTSKPNQPIEAKMVVIGNSIFATNGAFEQQLNGDVFLNSVQWLATGDEQPLSIRPREPKNRRIVLSQVQASSIFVLSIIVFPLLGFLFAGIIWWRRR